MRRIRNSSTTKAIWIEWRNPRTKEEASLYGQTIFDNDSTARIFINSRKNATYLDAVQTYWHELVHVFFHFHTHRTIVTDKKEESLCRTIERVLWEILNV